MKKIIHSLIIVSLLSTSILSLNACSNDNHNEEEISAAVSKNDYQLNVKVGSSKEYLIEQISNDFIKKPLDEIIRNEFNSKFFEVIDIINDSTNLPVSNSDLSIPNNKIPATIHFSYYKDYDQITDLTINTTGNFEVINMRTISDICVNVPSNVKVMRKSNVAKAEIEANIFPILSQKISAAVNNQKHIFIEETKDFIIKSDALPVDDYSTTNIKVITFTIAAVSTSKKIKNSIKLPIPVQPFVDKIDLDDIDDEPQSIEVKLNYETYNHIKTRISPYIYQSINKLDDTALENKDFELQFKNQQQETINLNDIMGASL